MLKKGKLSAGMAATTMKKFAIIQFKCDSTLSVTETSKLVGTKTNEPVSYDEEYKIALVRGAKQKVSKNFSCTIILMSGTYV